jgi:hypothetical protein
MNNVARGRARWSLAGFVFCAMVCLMAPGAFAQTAGEARFFAQCPQRQEVRLHREANPWDPHALLYTVLGSSEVEVLRVADWMIDAVIPYASVRPFQRTTQAIRAGYNRLPRWRAIERVGEFVDALHLAELSFGDATVTHSLATGGTAGPGSGMVVRIDKLVDWTQHVVGDLDFFLGCFIGRSRGLLGWAWPGRVVDHAQWMSIKTANRAMLFVNRVVEDAVSATEIGTERLLNLGYRPPHQHTTVFVRLPLDVYRAHELWLLEHRDRLVIGTADDFAQTTHAALAHRRRHLNVEAWDPVARLGDPARLIIVMTTTRVFARAPRALRPYAVPAAWILNAE